MTEKCPVCGRDLEKLSPEQKRQLAAELLRSANEDEGYWVQ